ncbi:GNAT family N-acetyltransferase [Niabella pedocola]|uniref:GNAT family N-acetyltransferase n=1 Tax=Niabella pedocola TaxID=1752077 RepID=A0ABS8PMN6_9BACT|nr:GNAT family N-acetyltransferase [Niabella pedocola]MCD2422369.1 GNAT family N-acetyltransferase [Niabella pedocola]
MILGRDLFIRAATATDMETLLEFEQKIIEAERPFDDSLKAGIIHYYDLLELIRSPAATVLLAVTGNEIIGSGYAKIVPAKPYQQYQEYAYLGFMYVKPAFRGMGVNQRIIQKLLEWAKGQGLTEARLDVYEENEAAKRSYQKIGFRANLLEMRLPL